MGMKEGWLHFERPSVCSLFDYSSEQMQTDRKIKTWNWPTQLECTKRKNKPYSPTTHKKLPIFPSVLVWKSYFIRFVCTKLSRKPFVWHIHADAEIGGWFWLAFIGIFADTWKISSYQWSTCPGHWLSAPLLPPSLSLGFCLPSSGILWCSIMVSSILKKFSFLCLNQSSILQNAIRTSCALYLMLGVQCSASYLLTLKAKNLSLPTFLHNKNSKVFVESTKFS